MHKGRALKACVIPSVHSFCSKVLWICLVLFCITLCCREIQVVHLSMLMEKLLVLIS
uniref:Uncharacterized protein n=1 Tax=Rhizophora mucronata TaxID=61149 RepID=A0A2P2K0U3_RHIMU